MSAAWSYDALGVASSPLYRVRVRVAGRYHRAVADMHVQSHHPVALGDALLLAQRLREEWAADGRLAALWVEDATGARFDVRDGELVTRDRCPECGDTGRVLESMAYDAGLVECAACVFPELGDDGEFYSENAADDADVRF